MSVSLDARCVSVLALGLFLAGTTASPVAAVTPRVESLLADSREAAKRHLPTAYALLSDAPEPAWSPIEAMRVAVARAEMDAGQWRSSAAREQIDAALDRLPAVAPARSGEARRWAGYAKALRQLVDEAYGPAAAAFRASAAAFGEAGATRAQADALFNAGVAAYSGGAYAPGLEDLRAAADRYLAAGDRSAAALALLIAGTTGTAQRLDDSMADTLDALTVFREEDNRVGLGMVYQNMGYDTADYEAGIQAFRTAIQLTTETGDLSTQVAAQAGLIDSLARGGRIAEAVAAAETGLRLIQQLKEPSAHMLRVSGLALGQAADPQLRARGESLLLQARDLYRRAGDLWLERACDANLAEVYLATGRLDEALELAELVADYTVEHQPEVHGGDLSLLIRIHEAREDWAAALAVSDERAAFLYELGKRQRSGDALELERSYQQELESLELDLLRTENELQAERLAAEQDRVVFLQAREAHLTRLRWLATGMVGFLLLVLLMVWRQWRRDRASARREADLHEALRESHRQLLESHQTLQAVDNQRRSLLRATSHDLKNPLAALVMLLDDMEETVDQASDDDGLRPLVRGCRRDLAHAQAVIDRMVRLQRGESLLESLQPRPVAVDSIAEQVFALNEPTAARKSLSLHVELEEGLTARADSQALREILDNLVSNAVKYNRPGGSVDLQGFARDGTVVLRVRDEGPGFQESDFDRLFQPFVRLSASPSAGESSTGLGLSIVRELTEAMAGQVAARNRRNRGAEIEVVLPRADPRTGAGAEDRQDRLSPLGLAGD